MNPPYQDRYTLTDSEARSQTPLSCLCVNPPNLMVEHGASAEILGQTALDAHQDARQLVRLIQCPKCSKPFNAPSTLPCGHTVCRACLPPPHVRTNISYPDTPNRRQGIACPISGCTAEHPTDECNVDVTMKKLMEVIRNEIRVHCASLDGYSDSLPEPARWEESEKTPEEEDPPRVTDARALRAGRLASFFRLAEMGELDYNDELSLQSLSLTSDDTTQLDVDLLRRLQEEAQKEMDCLVCYNLMLDPTTTACGHTFCRRCLARVLDHSSICPFCRQKLNIPASLQHQPSNERLVAILNSLCPEMVAARSSTLAAEEQAGDNHLDTPLFVCTLSLPGMPTFLHIFEPRYRLMMRRCLEGNRRFGMVLSNRTLEPQGELGAVGFMEYGTLLEIVKLDLLSDGRSFVESRGVSRFRVREHGMLDGYLVGRVEKVEDVSLAEEERQEAVETTAAQIHGALFEEQGREIPLELAVSIPSTQELLDQALQYVVRMRARSAPWISQRIVQIYGTPPQDPVIFPYWFASIVPIAEEEKFELLKTTTVRERLKIVNAWIRRIERQTWSGNACMVL